MAEVVRVTIKREELTAVAVPELRELFRLERLPLAESRLEVEMRGVPTAVVNALRRVLTDEMPGRALQVPGDGFDTALTTDVHMLPQFVNARIALIPLRAQISPETVEGLRLGLDITNASASVLPVYAGDLVVEAGAMPEPLFNPTFKLAVLQPGKRIVIRGIRITRGYGRDNAVYNVARLAAHRHLDIAQYGRRDTHAPGGAAVDQSGYKASCLVADPRHHVLAFALPATSPSPAEARAVLADACENIKGRLRLIAAAVERRADPAGGSHHGVQYTVVRLAAGLMEGVLLVPGETYTIGELLRRAVFEYAPEISNVTSLVVAHENRLNVSLRHTEDVTLILQHAIRTSIETFDILQRGIAAAR